MSDVPVQPLLDQIAQHQELWNSEADWRETKRATVLYGVDSIVLRTNKCPNDKPAMAVLTAAHPILEVLCGKLHAKALGNVVISRMRPGEVIKPHVDAMPTNPMTGQPFEQIYQRYQIPLSVHPGVEFHCGDEQVFMKPGEIWWFNNAVRHAVINNSEHDRIAMRADIWA